MGKTSRNQESIRIPNCTNYVTETMTTRTPDFHAVLIDITGYFTDTEPGKELLARCGGKIFYSGFFDDVNTYCCSLTPSVYIEVIDLVPEEAPEDDDERDALLEELSGLHTHDDSSYWSRRDVTRWRATHPKRFEALEIDFDEDDDQFDVVRETLSGNPVF